MGEQTLSDPAADRSWLRRHWRFLLLCLLLLCAELFVAFRWGVRGNEFIYWLFILDESHPDLFCNVSGLIALAAAVLILRARDLTWVVRVAFVVLYLLPLPVAFLGNGFLRFGQWQHGASIGFCGHVYYLAYEEFSGYSYAVYECDRFGLVCHQNNRIGVLVQPG